VRSSKPTLACALGQSGPRQPFRRGNRHLAENAARHHLVDQAQAQRPAGPLGFSGQNHVQRGTGPDQARKSLAPTGTRDQTQLDLGQPQLGLGMIGGNPVMTGERQLETTAEAGAVNGGDDRLVEGLDPADRLLALEAQPLGGVLVGQPGELLDIGAGDEVVGLTRDEHHCPDSGIIPEGDEHGFQLDSNRRGELVDRLAREVEGDDGDLAFAGNSERAHDC
jgi:hypothetical protein